LSGAGGGPSLIWPPPVEAVPSEGMGDVDDGWGDVVFKVALPEPGVPPGGNVLEWPASHQLQRRRQVIDAVLAQCGGAALEALEQVPVDQYARSQNELSVGADGQMRIVC
jgi:hypothetical protein